MLHIPKLVPITLLLALTSVVRGEIPTFVSYERSPDLPNGIAFYMTLRALDHLNTRFGPADPAGWVEQELGLSNVDSHIFVFQALTTLYIINTEVRAQAVRIACEAAGPSVNKKDQYNALQQMYASRNAITDHYFDQTKASLDAETGERLQQWMDDKKLSMAHMEIDFEKSYQISGNDPAVTLSGICGRAN